LSSTVLLAQTNPSSTKAPAAQKSGTGGARSSSARGPLPDPVLLDGSTHPAEKRSEYGMVGDFELPGDENSRNDRVGGNSQPPPQQGGGGAAPQPAGGAGLPQMPPSGGAGAAPSLPQIPDPLAQQGGQGGGGPENPNAAGKSAQGQGQQGAQPQGAQVGQLQGEGGGPEQGTIGEKPPQVSIGDQAMQIKTVPNAPSVVGGAQQQAGNTQQHEKTPGTGGKGAAGNNSNRGAERGRAIPAGL
jgi:hypothetical protein